MVHDTQSAQHAQRKEHITYNSDVMKTIQCDHPHHYHYDFVATCWLCTASGRVASGQWRSGRLHGWTHWTVFMNSYILLKSLKSLQWVFLSYQISLSLIIGNLKVSTLTNRKTTKGNCHISISLWNVTNFKRYQFYFFVYMCTFMGHCGENYPL